jgi:hypothetical protein
MFVFLPMRAHRARNYIARILALACRFHSDLGDLMIFLDDPRPYGKPL